MQLAPGPIPAITSDWYDSTISDPGNLTIVDVYEPYFEAIQVAMDASVDPIAAIDTALPDDGNDGDLLAIAGSMAVISGADTSPDQAIGDQQSDDLSGKMLVAYSVTPAEAFEPVPPQLLFPPGTPAPPQQGQATATITNLTRPGDTNFLPGDRYAIDVTLQPVPGGGGQYAGVGVLMYVAQGSSPWPNVNLCETDQYGRLQWQGTFQQTDVGTWVALFVPGGVAVASGLPAQGGLAWSVQLTWQVSDPGGNQPGTLDPAPAGATGLVMTQTMGQPCVQSSVTVTLENTSNPGQQNFISGDAWLLTVTGPPNSPVQIWALQNGIPLGSQILGNTDANGVFTLVGATADQYIGYWVENFEVGDQVWPGTLQFSVNAIPPAPPPPGLN